MRVLLTAPPLLASIEEFHSFFAGRGIETVQPPIVQTMSEEELEQLLPEFDGWIAGDCPVSRRVMAAGKAGRLRGIVKWGVGVDNVDFSAALDLGLPIANTPAVFGDEVADIAMGYVIALARETFRIDRGVRAGHWPKPVGISLAETSAALVGCGSIGRATARRLLASGMRVTVYDPKPADIPAGCKVRRWPDDIDAADFLILTCSLTPANRRMIDAELLRRCKPGVRIVNVSRGGLIDEAGLAQALATGHVHSAALDVFEREPLPAHSPLRVFEQCVFGSHNGSNTIHAVRRASFRAVDLLVEMLAAPPAPAGTGT